MLFRIALVIVLVAGLASAALNFVKVREKIGTLKSNLETERTARTQADAERNRAVADMQKAQQRLKEAETELATVKTERDTAIAEAETQKTQAAGLAEQLKKAKQDLSDAQAELAAWNALGVKPAQLRALQDQLRKLEVARLDLSNKLDHLAYQYYRATNELARYVFGEVVPALPANLTGRVLVVDPKWDFVVLDIGEDHGVVENGQLLVSRAGKLVAKVRVRSVEKDRSVANIMPRWKLGEVMEGDLVVP